ncbi:type IX secretion system outer membrane channel protein PorV [Flavobacterium sp. '19STA2R22 D10 B1']|uniref:type IX secretion system outer membrane channel protein PorV n=1 Tax=Flavobacterium aerium TaxID=3037261 RepID=UPI00278BDFFA|nr:type IX secretion system outer membrane channel protein PorV [Flavobacterium sp. '19STA2R22 D10 B1']
MKKLSILLIFLLGAKYANAQDRVITTGVPFLMIAADARSAGMGDMGVATSADAYSQQYNPAKYAFALDKQGFSVSYTPYLSSIANDISLAQVTYYNRMNERSAFAGSLRYFGLGEIELRQNFDDQPNVVKPNELALDLSYSLKLNERFSMAVAGRYIRSNLRIPDGNNDASAANTFAVDIAGFYQSEEQAYEDFNGRWRAGFNIQNLGPKISYNNDDFSGNFLPANLKLGGGFDFIFDEYNKLAVTVELNKLLVPTPQKPDLNGDGEVTSSEISQNNADYQSIGWVSGIFKSFGDAPDGFKEELKEFTYAVGAEYWYQDSFALRTGYFNESVEKGARKFFTLGAGFKYNVVKLDVSYLFSASKVRNPLENTLRFSLTFNFGDKYDEY